jgi:chorismate synthase
MASNSFGQLFKITTWGESHGPSIGVLIDGCPPGIEININEIATLLKKRAPGGNLYVTPRNESDMPQILSGVFNGCSTGAPISILIENQDSDSSKYEVNKDILKPGHAQFTYLSKYGNFDYRGGGRASARETACRVAAAAIAKSILKQAGIETYAYLCQVGSIEAGEEFSYHYLQNSQLFCPNAAFEESVVECIQTLKDAGDSIGGVVQFVANGLPVGLGDPIYQKLEADLASGMMSIPASKGFEIGSGFLAAQMKGSIHNDAYIQVGEKVKTKTNHAGGILAGITNGMPIFGRVAFKPTSSIAIPQESLSLEGKKTTFKLADGSRHDPCVAIRAVAVVDAMCALSLVDAVLMQKALTWK